MELKIGNGKLKIENEGKRDILDLEFGALQAILGEWGEPRFRPKQVWQWLYQKNVADFAAMRNVPASLREKLDAEFVVGGIRPIFTQHSSDGQTKKLLFQLHDGQLIETVLMRYDKRRTACISTQAGCAMGCVFCATGQMGFARNLTVAEIVAQVLYLNRELAATRLSSPKAENTQLTNIVMMGMGEPLHNYTNTLTALDRLTDPTGINLGARKITISTVGLVPVIRRYADEQRQSPLAISLHAATDVERSALLPVNRRWKIADLLDACHYYIAKTNRRLTFEWALINGENDTIEQATALGELLEGMLCHVNLIPLNPTQGYAGGPSSRERVTAFQQRLADFGVSSTVRMRRGIDIQAGCGQLRDRVVAEAHQKRLEIRD